MKKLVKFFLLLFLILIILVTLEYARQGYINDISLQPPFVNQQAPSYLVSYADGKDHIFRNQNAMQHYAINKGIDVIYNYRKDLIDPDFIKQNQQIFDEPIGAGMWLWKPYVILKTMQAAPIDSTVIYLDSGFVIKQPLTDIIEHLKEKDVILVHDHDRKNGSYVKGDSFALMSCLTEECRNAPHIWSAAIILKNTKQAQDFIKSWLKAAQNIKILSNKDYKIQQNYPEFKWHHFDQSVLSLVYCQNQNKIKLLEKSELKDYLSWFHRKGGKSSPLKTWYSIYGSEPIINFNNNDKTLASTAILNLPPIVRIRKWLIESGWFN